MSRRAFYGLLIGALTSAALYQGAFLVLDTPETAARISAFIQNVFMSGAFIAMVVARDGGRAQALDIGAARLIGTLATTISAGVLDGNTTLLGLGASCFVLDLTYLVLLGRCLRRFASDSVRTADSGRRSALPRPEEVGR